MRILKFWECFGIVAAAAFLFLMSYAIATATKATPVPVWQRSCMAYLSKDERNLVQDCGNVKNNTQIGDPIAALVRGKNIPIVCNGFKEHWPSTDIDLECRRS